MVFVVQLLIYGFHEPAEANVFPESTRLHDATEAYRPDGIYGKWLSFGLVAIPLLWLCVSYLIDARSARRQLAPDNAR